MLVSRLFAGIMARYGRFLTQSDLDDINLYSYVDVTVGDENRFMFCELLFSVIRNLITSWKLDSIWVDAW